MKQPQVPKEIVKQIQTSFWLALLFPLLVLTLFHFLVTMYKEGGMAAEDANFAYSLFIILIGTCIVTIPSTIYISRNRIKRIEKSIPLQKKLYDYRDAFFWNLYGVEFCLLFSAIYYLLIANVQVLILSASLLILLITLIPTKERIANDLGLSQKERFEI
ncbi:MAG TPA: hypothetical protein DCQ26_09430 [Marinilabiliales bacterium]|jgi:hypothetical protein|nr:MAG: hypothetical protein A2W95_02465 [Bacteroidetes bacterium GWA2_40_14]OFX63299.1 MAG: hypothetical protein A2W84_03160 [Bacteroidetes bacterium GWC2_40_13]OFX74607.1 MAG: hypothetical protein A2W96_04000 [Bacteroidetes bacterium GWD2_40_43]OFX88969.1 MAG: hypothetical protein A2W97_09920 [Bacteroidetes bacterium GWE2_40_63]OFY22775.1 MAG: hypothetical protein A2W88_00210 [Bacteroidetes bacterium GWF2_40_13]OFZ32123.1 MAG: hypothetical protein A2437_19225 [Bacteroidetes bacterium RIFOXYC